MTLQQLKEDANKEFDKKIRKKNYGACFECCDYENIMNNIKDFIDFFIIKAYEEGKKENKKYVDKIYCVCVDCGIEIPFGEVQCSECRMERKKENRNNKK